MNILFTYKKIKQSDIKIRNKDIEDDSQLINSKI